jgi:hypothetical protein
MGPVHANCESLNVICGCQTLRCAGIYLAAAVTVLFQTPKSEQVVVTDDQPSMRHTDEVSGTCLWVPWMMSVPYNVGYVGAKPFVVPESIWLLL